MKIGLALIVKPTDDEALLLDRCLDTLHEYVDGIYITQAGPKPNQKVAAVIKKYKGVESFFRWRNDFSAARNYNFSQVPKEMDYIMWTDADDVWRGMEDLKETMAKAPKADAFAFWYLYDFDADRQPIVAHKKTMIVKHDVAEWKGKLHEDLMPKRQISLKFIEGVERMHLTDGERVAQAQERNVEISAEEVKERPNDPRSYWNYGNSLLAKGEFNEAIEQMSVFLEKSHSEEERYIALTRLASAYQSAGNPTKSVESLQQAIGSKPDFPDAYLQLGYIYYETSQLEKAEHYLLMGLQTPPKYHEMIVFNPRDYDYNPMKLLIQIFFAQNRPDKAIPFIEACLKIYPNHRQLKDLLPLMIEQKRIFETAVKKAQEIDETGDKVQIATMLDALDDDVKSHPIICRIRNKHFVKNTSSGKDLAYVCYHTEHEWNPELFKTKGVGGSEEAVIHLAKQWADKGWNVTVYNNCGVKEMKVDGVTYKPVWMYNVKDKQDVTILWRQPRLAGRNINTTKLFVDVHDVIPEGEFTEERLYKIDKILVKTQFHRSLYPNVPDNKFAVIPNGHDIPKATVKRDSKLIINTSSPDRSMDAVPAIFKKIKEQVPEAKMKWAYGWDIFEQAHANNGEMMKWMRDTKRELKKAGVESLGKISQAEAANLYHEGAVMLYPTEFAEIDCISVKKAQGSGCVPVTSDFGALAESVQYGTKVHSHKTKDNWALDYQFAFGMKDRDDEFVEAVVKELKNPMIDKTNMINWAKKFEWPKIAGKWARLFV